MDIIVTRNAKGDHIHSHNVDADVVTTLGSNGFLAFYIVNDICKIAVKKNFGSEFEWQIVSSFHMDWSNSFFDTVKEFSKRIDLPNK